MRTGAQRARGPGATLYAAGHAYGEWFWHFTSVPGYDCAAAEAQAGLTSVTIDKLGYGASGIPDGNNVGYGTQATAARYRSVNTAFLYKRGYGFRGCTP